MSVTSVPCWGRLKFMFTPLAIVDLVAFLPFYLIPVLPEHAVRGGDVHIPAVEDLQDVPLLRVA